MPSPAEHLERARLNLKFAESIDLNGHYYLDWAVTAYFYAALHLVSAISSRIDACVPNDHFDCKKNFLSKKWYLRAIRNPYLDLQDFSEGARYRLYPFTRVKIEADIIPLFREIERHIDQLAAKYPLDQPAGAPPAF